MSIKRMVAGFAAVAALVGVTLAAPAGASTPEPASEAAQCRYGQWPSAVEGRPTMLKPGAAAGIYVWHDANGWHLFATHPGHARAVFRGRVVSSSHLYAVERDDERRDEVVVSPRDKAFDFRFVNHGYLDGAAFHVTCGRVIGVTGTLDGKRLTSDQVFVGRDGHHPNQVPFEVVRVR